MTTEQLNYLLRKELYAIKNQVIIYHFTPEM